VHAATFIRQREIILETRLLSSPNMLRLILVHEIFHFVWCRLPNSARRDFAQLLTHERKHHARGELGESSAVKKSSLPPGSAETCCQWRDYCCESFCDTAAWLYAGLKDHQAFTLSNRWKQRRRSWFETVFSRPFPC